MSDFAGRFIWYELMTTDTTAAKAFYGKVAGWSANAAPAPNDGYTLFNVGQTGIGGLMTLPQDARTRGVPPCWTGYVAVDDVDAKTEQAKRLGGAVHMPPTDIPSVGRFSVIADPQGAVIALFKPSDPPPGHTPPPQGTPGHFGWRELWTSDWQKAVAFYGEMFGWQKAEAVDMGPIGTYQLFSISGEASGGMFNKPAEVPACFWLYYTNVDDIDAATERVKANGGTVMMGPMEVPGGDWIIQATDPQGAMFALVGKRG